MRNDPGRPRRHGAPVAAAVVASPAAGTAVMAASAGVAPDHHAPGHGARARQPRRFRKPGRRARTDMLGRLDGLVSLGEAATLPFGPNGEVVDSRYDASSGRIEFGANASRPIELQQNPETTGTLIRTALEALGDVDAETPAPGVAELMNYYRSVLRAGEDGSPRIVRAPTAGPRVA